MVIHLWDPGPCSDLACSCLLHEGESLGFTLKRLGVTSVQAGGGQFWDALLSPYFALRPSSCSPAQGLPCSWKEVHLLPTLLQHASPGISSL